MFWVSHKTTTKRSASARHHACLTWIQCMNKNETFKNSKKIICNQVKLTLLCTVKKQKKKGSGRIKPDCNHNVLRMMLKTEKRNTESWNWKNKNVLVDVIMKQKMMRPANLKQMSPVKPLVGHEREKVDVGNHYHVDVDSDEDDDDYYWKRCSYTAANCNYG